MTTTPGGPARLPTPMRIAGVGRRLPERRVSNAELEALTGVAPGWIESYNGVRERRWATPSLGESAVSMAVEAAREALDDAGVAGADLDLVLNASGTPEQAIPDNAPLVQRGLGLGDSGIPAFSVHATCLSFLVALDVAAAYMATGRARRVLIVSSDVASPGLDFKEPESSTLMGDAAAATVLVAPEAGETGALEAVRFETYGEGSHLAELAGFGSRRPADRPGADPPDALFHMRGLEMLKVVMRRAPRFLERLSPGLARGRADVAMVVPHQTSRAGLRALSALGYEEARVAETLSVLGNCVAASIPATLHEVVRTGRIRRGERMLLVGTSAGVSLGGAVLTY